ncbi:unnamed protein product [Vitrella brassicaformis CCMP3155]|uniref:Tyrosine-protein kinase ephrin type A/B receptor-like domain-containing protein n=1 Tax=Vitrella brassicaformis (strain CCMP3155) TaxID=1169540 RepID=A0A0G4GIU3_VITBC|nr:unnamed protein product [Vitrella brassicaformis CCMP3155]|eukprot:CEM29626.1 unnamed protein product [Vitrella brassicaformis CCMP3155]
MRRLHEGFHCEGRSVLPRVKESYGVDKVADPTTVDKLDVYRCSMENACPPRYVNETMCKEGATGRVCERCEEGYFKKGPGRCGKCKTTDFSAFWLFLFLGVVVAIILYATMNRPLTNELASSVAISMALGLMLNFFQTIGIYNNLQIVWNEPFLSILQFGRVSQSAPSYPHMLTLSHVSLPG